MAICDLCLKQAKKQRHQKPHKFLKPIGGQRDVNILVSKGFKEQDYVCTKCDAHFTYGHDKYDYGWILFEK